MRLQSIGAWSRRLSTAYMEFAQSGTACREFTVAQSAFVALQLNALLVHSEFVLAVSQIQDRCAHRHGFARDRGGCETETEPTPFSVRFLLYSPTYISFEDATIEAGGLNNRSGNHIAFAV